MRSRTARWQHSRSWSSICSSQWATADRSKTPVSGDIVQSFPEPPCHTHTSGTANCLVYKPQVGRSASSTLAADALAIQGILRSHGLARDDDPETNEHSGGAGEHRKAARGTDRPDSAHGVAR